MRKFHSRAPTLFFSQSALVILLAVMLGQCTPKEATKQPGPVSVPASSTSDGFAPKRRAMVDRQLRARGITARHVLDAMEATPRHLFVPEMMRPYAYDDSPLPIGKDQTISQPYIVAFMTQELKLSGAKTERCFEVGTGSGYQAAVLSQVCKDVYTIEIVEELATRARATLASLDYANVHVRTGDGYRGWPEFAPFEAVLVTAAADHIPQPLIDQLAPGGRLVMPVGGRYVQDLMVLTKAADGMTHQTSIPVRFVPLTGEAEKH